jgi:transcriptional regulator with XRE-family HTH domain
MATAELSVFCDAHAVPLPAGEQVPAQLHRIQEVRCRQGMSLRSAARQLGTDVRSVRAQEQPGSDLRLSDLYRWHAILDVPIDELLSELAVPLSRPVAERAKLVRIMKTAQTLRDGAKTPAQRRMADNLVEQLVDLMPELAEVSPWHSVGVRRSLDDLGRIAEQTIDDNSLFGGTLSE